MLAEPGIAEAVGVNGAILLPQESPRDATPSQLAFHMGPVGCRSRVEPGGLCRGEEKPLEGLIVEVIGQGPGETSRASALKITVHGAVADPQSAGDQAFAQAVVVLEP